jgi:DNA-binding CsgD family transcriptional regulator
VNGYKILLTLSYFLFGIGTNPSFGILQDRETDLVPYLINDFELHNQNWSISQNPNNNLIYLANSEGLFEFNGIKWIKHTLKEKLPLRSVAVDRNGVIYTGSFEDFGYWKADNQGKLGYTSLSTLTQIEKNDEIWKIFIQGQNIYFQSFTSIYVYNHTKLEKVVAPYTMLFLHLVNDQFVAQIFEKGLYFFENNDFKFIDNSEIFSNKKVHTIISYRHGEWLVCTDKYGIFHYDGVKFTRFNSDASIFLENFICNTAIKLDDSTFVFGSILNGLIITSPKGEILRKYNTHNGLKNNTILSLFADMEGGLWVGLDEGVNYIDLSSPFTHYKCKSNSIGTIYAMHRKDNKLYIGTNHGLFVSDIKKKGQFYSFDNLRIIDQSQGQVWSLEEYEGQIICGHNNGTFRVNNEQFEQISGITGGWAYTPFGEYILGGTYTGIVVFRKNANGKWQHYSKLDNFMEPSRYIEVDYLGYVWASHHQKGVYRIEISDDFKSTFNTEFFPSINNETYNIKVFKINNRVIFITSENVYTYDYIRNEIVVAEPLTNTIGEYRTANQITHYQKNEYWFIKDDKLALFDISLDFTATKLYEIQLKNISLPQRNIELIRLDSNTVLIPTPESFDAFDLSVKKKDINETKLKIEKVIFYGGNNESKTHIYPLHTLKTKWKRNNISVFFIAPYSFDHPNKQYSYRIVELDSIWQHTLNCQFTYPALKYGEYTVQIKDYTDSTIRLRFAVGKPWYYSTASIIGYVITFLIAIWLSIKYLRYKINREKEISTMAAKQNSLEKELDYKNYELMLTIRYLINKNEILTELQKQILKIKEHSSKYPIKNLRDMEQIITEGLQTQTEDWKNALNNLKLSQQGFNKKLLEHFPDLTSNDLRLCSYLRMNFSTKEIARLLNNSPRAVEISRYRLRKKMNLNHDVNLTEFLMSEIFSESIRSSDSVS